jgi:hypothetical protein
MKCGVQGCPAPLGNQNKGFTKQGLGNHTNKLHNPDSTYAQRKRLEEEKTRFSLDPGNTNGVSVGYDTDGEGNEIIDFTADINNQTPKRVDFGTPGDEKVMGPATSFMDDVRSLVDPNAPIYQGLKPSGTSALTSDGIVFGWDVIDREGKKHFVRNPNLTDDEHMQLYGQLLKTPVSRFAPVHHTFESLTRKSSAPVDPYDNEGVRLKALGGRLYVDMGEGWEDMELETFYTFVRFAVKIS